MRSRGAAFGLVAYFVVLGLLVLWPTHPEAFLNPQLVAVTDTFAANPLTAWITYGVMNGVANVILFIPMTLLAALAFGRGWWFVIFAAGAAAAALAELAQWLFLPGRTPDVSDIIAGSIGSLLGTAIGIITVTRTRKREEAPSPDGTGE